MSCLATLIVPAHLVPSQRCLFRRVLPITAPTFSLFCLAPMPPCSCLVFFVLRFFIF